MTVDVPSSGQSYATTLDNILGNAAIWDTDTWDNFSWVYEGVSYLVRPLPQQSLLGYTLQVEISASVTAFTEIIPPITVEYRESNRFV